MRKRTGEMLTAIEPEGVKAQSRGLTSKIAWLNRSELRPFPNAQTCELTA
jgi:hypothetical protein